MPNESKTIMRIVITGPESSGKSTLAEALAKHYNAIHVPEYARQYLAQTGGNYDYGDLLRIAKAQMALEDAAAHLSDRLVICDTGLLVMKIWSLHAYKKCHPWILDQLEKRPYAHRFLTRPDMPWQPDPLREHPELRQHLFGQYQRELERTEASYTILEGSHETRMETAVQTIDKLMA